MSATDVAVAPVNEEGAAAPVVVREAMAHVADTTFHLDQGLAQEDPDNYLVVHELLGRGQLLNAYEVSAQTTRARKDPAPAPRCVRSIRASRVSNPAKKIE